MHVLNRLDKNILFCRKKYVPPRFIDMMENNKKLLLVIIDKTTSISLSLVSCLKQIFYKSI